MPQTAAGGPRDVDRPAQGFIRSGAASMASASGCSRELFAREVTVSSFVGVLGITVVLFLVVAVTARLILGR
jgi:hypothetical protein